MPNRFFKLRPVTFEGIQMYEPNFDLLNQVLGSQQDTFNRQLTSAESIRDLIPKGGYATKGIAGKLRTEYDSAIDDISDQLLTTGNVIGGDRAILNLARNLKRDPRFDAASRDIAYEPNAMKTLAHPEFGDAIQDFYSPESGFRQITDEEAATFDPASYYRTIFPEDWNKGYMDTLTSTIRDNITYLDKEAVEFKTVPNYDVNGNLVGSKMVLITRTGVQKDLSRDRVKDLLTKTNLGRNLFESQIVGRNFRQAQFEKVNGRTYDYMPFIDDLLSSGEGQYYSDTEYKYDEELASQVSPTKSGKTTNPSDSPGFRVIGDIHAQGVLGEDGLVVSDVLIKTDEDGNADIIDPTTDVGKVEVYQNSIDKMKVFETGDDSANGGLMGMMKATGALGDDSLGILMESYASENLLSNYFTESGELGIPPLSVHYVAERPELRENMKDSLKFSNGEDVPDDEEDIYLNQALHKIDVQAVGPYVEALTTKKRIDSGIRRVEENRISDRMSELTGTLEDIDKGKGIGRLDIATGGASYLVRKMFGKSDDERKQIIQHEIDLLQQYGLVGSEIAKLEGELQTLPTSTRGEQADVEVVRRKASDIQKRINNLKANRLNDDSMRQTKAEIIAGLDSKYFPAAKKPATYVAMTFVPNKYTEDIYQDPTTAQQLKGEVGMAEPEGSRFGKLVPGYNKEAEEYTQSSEVNYYNFIPMVDGEAKDVGNYKVGQALTLKQRENIMGVQPGGFTQLSDGRYALLGKPIYKDGVVDDNVFVLDNGRDEFTREMAKMLGNSNPAYLADIFMNNIEYQELSGIEAKYSKFEDKGLIPGATIVVKKGRDIEGNQWNATITFRDKKTVQMKGRDAYDISNQISPYIKAGNSGTFASEIDWNKMRLFNPDNDFSSFKNTTLDYGQIQNPALDPEFYTEYAKIEAGFPTAAVATDMTRSLERAKELGASTTGSHVHGKGLDLSDNPNIVKYLQDMAEGDIESGLQRLKGTNLYAWRHRSHDANNYHIHIEMK